MSFLLGKPGSNVVRPEYVDMQDHSRFRSTSFVPHQQIELMQGSLNIPFQNADPESHNYTNTTYTNTNTYTNTYKHKS
jgi:hypothetical protein